MVGKRCIWLWKFEIYKKFRKFRAKFLFWRSIFFRKIKKLILGHDPFSNGTKIKNFTYIDAETIITPFFTSEYCDYLIKTFEDYGWTIDKNGNFDTYLHVVKGVRKFVKIF